MKDGIKEIKIGMYSSDEILEFMTNGEGRGFMGRSMYDAIIDYITNLQEENERLNNIINELEKLIEQYSQNDYYYKYNGKYLKSEIINDLKELKEKK